MALNIEVNSTFKITSDSMNVIVNRSHIVDPTKGPKWKPGDSTETREEWRAEKWFATVEHALKYIVDQSVREGNAETLAELLAEITAIKRQISEVMA